jgi:hypothetical protein
MPVDGIGTALSASAILSVIGESSGTDFWVAFQDIAANQCVSQMKVLITRASGGASAVATVTLPPPYGATPYSVAPGTTTVIDIPQDLEVEHMEEKEDKGIHITSSEAVSVTGFYLSYDSSEAFLVYPVPRLGNRYRVLASAQNLQDGTSRSEFTILATSADPTTVAITPSARSGLTARQVTLNRGQTYQMGTFADIAGTLLSSDRPIAVFAGSALNREPSSTVDWANPEVEQQIPSDAWGTHLFAIPFGARGNAYGDAYRVIADQDGTLVTVNGTTLATTLNAGDISDSEISPDWATILRNTHLEFTSNHPIQVAHISKGAGGFDGVTGDPFETLLPHVGQYTSSATFWVPPRMPACGDSPAFDWASQITIIVTSADATNTVVDGTFHPTFNPIGTSGYSYAQYPLPTAPNGATHTVTSSGAMCIEVYGFGLKDGYGYLGNIKF